MQTKSIKKKFLSFMLLIIFMVTTIIPTFASVVVTIENETLLENDNVTIEDEISDNTTNKDEILDNKETPSKTEFSDSETVIQDTEENTALDSVFKSESKSETEIEVIVEQKNKDMEIESETFSCNLQPTTIEIAPLAIIILPSGSTSADLQNEINTATSGDVIEISSDITFSTPTVTIPSGKTITLQSTTGNNWTLSQTSSLVRHFTVNGNLILQNITVDGNSIGGGIRVNDDADLTINDGTVIQNCTSGGYQTRGGGIIVNSGGIITMNAGKVNNNSAYYGGGIYSYGTLNILGGSFSGNEANTNGGAICSAGTINISNTTISENTSFNGCAISIEENCTANITGGCNFTNNHARNRGGAIFVYQNSTLNISGTNYITNNTSEGHGGGIFIGSSNTAYITGTNYITNNTGDAGGGIYSFLNSTLNISDTNYITNNTAINNGGGIYVEETSTLNINGTTHITDNIATGNGGGIYTQDTTYTNINTSNNTAFSGNTASLAYFPPENAKTLYTNIGFSNISITDHPLNNYDINYEHGVLLTYNVTYDANGGTGDYTGANIMPGSNDVVLSLSDTGINRQNHTFLEWNISPDGSGTSYEPGDSITLNDNVTLYAQWKINEYTISFDSNGGTPINDQSISYGDIATKPDNPTKPGFTFGGWFTDDTFQNNWDFNSPITEAITLYAKWIEDVPCEPDKPDEPCEPDKPDDSTKPDSPSTRYRPYKFKKICNPKTEDISIILLTICICLITISIIGILYLISKLKKVLSKK